MNITRDIRLRDEPAPLLYPVRPRCATRTSLSPERRADLDARIRGHCRRVAAHYLARIDELSVEDRNVWLDAALELGLLVFAA